jgi:hypothetical protein
LPVALARACEVVCPVGLELRAADDAVTQLQPYRWSSSTCHVPMIDETGPFFRYLAPYTS